MKKYIIFKFFSSTISNAYLTHFYVSNLILSEGRILTNLLTLLKIGTGNGIWELDSSCYTMTQSQVGTNIDICKAMITIGSRPRKSCRIFKTTFQKNAYYPIRTCTSYRTLRGGQCICFSHLLTHVQLSFKETMLQIGIN